MNCKKCGLVLEPNAAFCPNCGEPVANQNGVVTTIPPIVGTPNVQVPAQQPMENFNAQEPVQRVAAPIMPEAPEAPLPGTQSIPVVNATTEDPANQAMMGNTQNVVTNPVAQVPVQPQIQGAPIVDPTQKTKKKVSPLVLIIIVVLVLGALALMFVLLDGKSMLGGSKPKTTSSTSTSTTSSSTTTRPLVKEQMTLNGVKIFVPFGFTIDPLSTEELGIINNVERQTQININALPSQNFEEYSNNFEGLASIITTDEITVISSEKKMVGERLFLMFLINVNGKEEYLCYTNVRDGSVIRFELVQAGMTIDDALNIFIDIAEFAVPEVEIPVE